MKLKTDKAMANKKEELTKLKSGLSKAEEEIYIAHCGYINEEGRDDHFDDLFQIATEAISRYKRSVIKKGSQLNIKT